MRACWCGTSEAKPVGGDANQVLYVRSGESYRVSAPLPGGYSELIVTPDLDVLSEIACASGAELFVGCHQLE